MIVDKIQQPPVRDLPPLTDRIGTPIEGHIFHLQWIGWFKKLAQALNTNLAAGYSGTITLAALTSGGTQGSITVTNGIITAVTEPT